MDKKELTNEYSLKTKGGPKTMTLSKRLSSQRTQSDNMIFLTILVFVVILDVFLYL